MSAKIKAEGHKIMAMMDRVGVSLKDGGGIQFTAQIVTATPDLKRWYIVSGDAPLSKRSSRMCVSDAGRNLEINDYRRNGIPTVTRYRFDRGKALADCDGIAQRFLIDDPLTKYEGVKCNEFNEGVRILGQDLNERIALQGITDQRILMTVVANPENKRDYRLLATTPAGATYISRRGVNFSFSDQVLSVLDSR